MQLLEVRNDIAKIMYNPAENKLLPSDFLLIEDLNQKLVGQILSIYTTNDLNNNIADVRLALYIDKENQLSYYNGYIPQKTAKIIYVTTDEITEMIADSENNIYLGNLTYHQKSFVKAPLSLVNERLYIQCDREDNTKMIVQNIVSALYMLQRKVVLLDFDGRYNRISNVPRLVISESFKFPLNEEAFDNILEYDIADCPIEDKAVIQSIVLELREYIRTLENHFLPFTLFKNVVINEFASNPISGLMVLRNKLWKYAQEGLFAETKSDFDIINTVMNNENIVIVDASKIEEKWHKFTIQTIADILSKHCYFAFSLNDISMDKRSILSIYNNQNIIPIVSTSYDSPYRNILKSLSKNQILFKPSKQTEVEEQYGVLVHKLNDNDFILFGETCLNLPLIIELKPFDIKTAEKIEELEIRRNVDKILSMGKSMLPKEAVITEQQKQNTSNDVQYIVDEDFTDEDLDFIDNIKTENLSIDDLREQKQNIELDDKKDGYDLFDPFIEIENTNRDVSQIENDNVINKNENSSEELDKFDFNEIINESSDENEQIEQIDNEPSNDEKGQTVEIENNLDIIKEENTSTSVDKDIESYSSSNQENSKNIKNTHAQKAACGYFKNEASKMDFIPDLPSYNDDEITYKDEDLEKEEAEEIESVENLSLDDIQGFGFGEIDDDFVDLSENENSGSLNDLLEEKNDTLLEEKKTSDLEKKNVNDTFIQDEKILEDIFPDETKTNKTTEPFELVSEISSKNEDDRETMNDALETLFRDTIENQNAEIELQQNEQIISQNEEQLLNDENASKDVKNENYNESSDLLIDELFDGNEIKKSDLKQNKNVDDINIERKKDEKLIEKSLNLFEDELFYNNEIEEDIVENEVFSETEEEKIIEENNVEPELDDKIENVQTEQEKNDEDEIVSIDNVIENIKQNINSENDEKSIKKAELSKKTKREDEVSENEEINNSQPEIIKQQKNRIENKKLTVYETDTTDILSENRTAFKVGDRVYHPKHGHGIVEGFANYSNKILFCQIEFDNVGRRILDPRISGLEKI